MQRSNFSVLQHWKAIEKPSGWSRLPNPISHHGSFMFTDGLQLAMVMPFVLSRSLSPIYLKRQTRCNQGETPLLAKQRRLQGNGGLWAIEAKALRTTFDEEDYERLGVILQEELSALLRERYYIINALQG